MQIHKGIISDGVHTPGPLRTVVRATEAVIEELSGIMATYLKVGRHFMTCLVWCQGAPGDVPLAW